MLFNPYYFMLLYRLTSSCILMELKLYLPDIRRSRWRSENCCRHAPKKGRNGKTCRCLHCPSWYMYSHSKQLLMHKIYMHAHTHTHHTRICWIKFSCNLFIRRLWNHGRAVRDNQLVSAWNSWKTSKIKWSL